MHYKARWQESDKLNNAGDTVCRAMSCYGLGLVNTLDGCRHMVFGKTACTSVDCNTCVGIVVTLHRSLGCVWRCDWTYCFSSVSLILF